MNKKLNKNNGITLISLVITIIIMLILVGVSINLAVNGGLFEYAGNAVGDTKNAMKNEQDLVNTIIDKYIKPNTGEAVHSWTKTEKNGETWFVCSHCPEEYKLGQEVNYRATGVESTTLSAEKSGLKEYKDIGQEYPTSTAINQENGTQTITRDDNIKWVVLGIENTDNDEEGIYETLLITTEKAVYESADENGIYVGGKAAYLYMPDELDRICEELYSNSKYGTARNMKIEDVFEALEYKNANGVYADLDDEMGYPFLFKPVSTDTILGDVPGVHELVNENTIDNTKTPDGKDLLTGYTNNAYFFFITTNTDYLEMSPTLMVSADIVNSTALNILENTGSSGAFLSSNCSSIFIKSSEKEYTGVFSIMQCGWSGENLFGVAFMEDSYVSDGSIYSPWSSRTSPCCTAKI